MDSVYDNQEDTPSVSEDERTIEHTRGALRQPASIINYNETESNPSEEGDDPEGSKFESRLAITDVYGDGASVRPRIEEEKDEVVLRRKPGTLEYLPLVLVKEGHDENTKEDSEGALFREHIGNPNITDQPRGSFRALDLDTCIERQSREGMKALVCVTMYNEPYSQLVATLAGIYRNYYELVATDASYEDKLSIVIVTDGYQVFNKIGADDPTRRPFHDSMKRAGIYHPNKTKKYVK